MPTIHNLFIYCTYYEAVYSNGLSMYITQSSEILLKFITHYKYLCHVIAVQYGRKDLKLKNTI